MNPKKELHIKRLRERLEAIPSLLSEAKTTEDPEFQAWHNQTKRSLIEIFGNSSSYNRDFNDLRFNEIRIRTMREPKWTIDDQKVFVDGLRQAERIMKDALEEAEILSATVEPLKEEIPAQKPQIVINITNTLSQFTHVEISQVLQNLNSIGLTSSQKEEAERLAKELDAETKGEKRWPVLSRCLQGLRDIGDHVYKQVAIPLLLEMLKKEMGL